MVGSGETLAWKRLPAVVVTFVKLPESGGPRRTHSYRYGVAAKREEGALRRQLSVPASAIVPAWIEGRIACGVTVQGEAASRSDGEGGRRSRSRRAPSHAEIATTP